MNRAVNRCALAAMAGLLPMLVACFTHDIPRFGIGGRYEEGRSQFLLGRGGDMDRAIVALESVVSEDPTYKNSLTYLGRAYYRKRRYEDSYAILQRALAVNKDDEMAWISLGLAQLRLGQNEKGVETLKGGITLANRVLVDGYHYYEFWDERHLIRNALRRSAFLLAKGVEEKPNILGVTDQLLLLIDEEENFQKNNALKEFNRNYQSQ